MPRANRVRLRPGFRLRVIDKWVGDRLIFRFEIENTSAVFALAESAHAEVHERPLAKGGWLPHRVAFSKNETEKKETVIFDSDIEEETTDRIYPREVMAVERVYDFPDDAVVVHVGFQVRLRKRRWIFFVPLHQQTTTAYFVKPVALAAA